MLLFVRKQYSDAIKQGLKTYEVRAGARYSKIRPGSALSINGHFRVSVTRVERHDSIENLLTSLAGMPFPLSAADMEACYPGVSSEFYVFHFTPPADVQHLPAA